MTIQIDSMALATLKYCGLPTSKNNVESLVIWAISEGSQAKWNPWDTTEPMNGHDTEYNSVGVRNYDTILTGVEAFRRTLFNGDYNDIIGSLLTSAPPAITCSHICNSPWGSKPGPTLVSDVLANFASYASRGVAGSETTTNLEVTKAVSEVGPLPVVADPSQLSSTPTGVPEAPPPNETTTTQGPAPTMVTVEVPQLKEGDNGAAVRVLQEILKAKVFASLPVDGQFGPETTSVVRVAQKLYRIAEDGIVGPDTWAHLLNQGV